MEFARSWRPLQTSIDAASLAPNAEIAVFRVEGATRAE